ncbi:MAG: hypothetical protein QXO75_02675 [Nitrososphaerota archaeon]
MDKVVSMGERLAKNGKILLDNKYKEFVYFTPEELEDLYKTLSSQRVSIKDLSEKLGIRENQVLLVINKLVKEKNLRGVILEDPTPEFVHETFIDKEIEECEKALSDLSERFTRREITEEAFVLAARPFKERLEKLTRLVSEKSSILPDQETKKPKIRHLPCAEVRKRATEFFTAREYSIKTTSDTQIVFSDGRDVNWWVFFILLIFVAIIGAVLYYFLATKTHEVIISLRPSVFGCEIDVASTTSKSSIDANDFLNTLKA